MRLLQLLVSISILACLTSAQRAHACTPAPPIGLVVLYSEIPTNAPILFKTHLAPDTVALLDASSGTVEAMQLVHARSEDSDGPAYVELIPTSELDPNASYRVAFQLPNEPNPRELRFQTGSGPIEAPSPSLDDIRLSMLLADEVGDYSSTCGPPPLSRVCLSDPGDEVGLDLTYRSLDGDLMGREILAGGDTERALPAAELCIEVRARNVLGERSDALTICTDEADILEVHELFVSTMERPSGERVYECEAGEWQAVVEIDDVLIPDAGFAVDAGATRLTPEADTRSGCGCSTGPRATPSALLVILMLGLALRSRPRSRTRACG